VSLLAVSEVELSDYQGVEDLHASKGETLTLYWYNPESGLWEVEQEVNICNLHAEFSIYHFWRCAIKR
jgi:hypothetical protein